MVTCTQSINVLASDYTGLGSWLGLCTASPGTASAPTASAEAVGASYARLTTSWATVSAGVSTGSAVTLSVSAATYTYMLVASSSSGSNMTDNATITSVVMGASGQIVVTPTFTQT